MYNRQEQGGGYGSRGTRFPTANYGQKQNFQGRYQRNDFIQRNPNSFRQNMQYTQPPRATTNPVPHFQQQSMDMCGSVAQANSSMPPTPSTSSSLPVPSCRLSASVDIPNKFEWPNEQSGVISGGQKFYNQQSQRLPTNIESKIPWSSQDKNYQKADKSNNGDNFFLKVHEGVLSGAMKTGIQIPGLDVSDSQEDISSHSDHNELNFGTNTLQRPPAFDGSMQGFPISSNCHFFSTPPTSECSYTFMNQRNQQQHATPQFIGRPPSIMQHQNQHFRQNPGIRPPHVPPSSFINVESRPPPSNIHVPNQFFHQQSLQLDPQTLHNSCHNQQQSDGSSVDKVETSRKEKDLQWINDWLKHRRLKKKQDACISTGSSGICDAQEKIKRMMFLMASLQKQIKVLSSCDQDQFDDEMKASNKIREEMDSIRKHLKAIDTAELQKKILLRKQKRERLKRQKQARYEAKQKDMGSREQLHRQIDSRLKVLHDREKEKIQEKEVKKNADIILCEVRKKTQDVTRSIDLLKNLSKLRKLRKDRLNNQGVHTKPECDGSFTDKIDECLETLKKQKKVYDAENKALRVMMETEQEENKEKERFQLQNKENKERKKVDRMLFGEDEPLNPGDPMFLFRQYYDQARSNIDSLIQTRCDWDRYIVPEGTPCASRIPDGFVVPVDPTSEVWASRLKDI